MARYTKFICTLGPASAERSVIQKLNRQGMDVARVNFSHGDRSQHAQMFRRIKKAKRNGVPVGILADLEGYRIRVGELPEDIILKKGHKYVISKTKYQGEGHIPFNFDGDIRSVKTGMKVFIDDGMIQLSIRSVKRNELQATVAVGGRLSSHKGINIPGLKMERTRMTQKDRNDLAFIIKNKADMVAQSFVRNANDVRDVVDYVKPRLPRCRIIAKIENEEGLRNIEAIIDACDGVMIARGDLGVSMPIYKVPMLQKYIIRHSNRKKKLSITATQMLDSMIKNKRPTRAEVSDVANAVLDGTDYVMLSGETAIGLYPALSVQMIRRIVSYTEGYEKIRI